MSFIKLQMIQFVRILLMGMILSSCDKELSTTPPEPPPPTGLLRIESTPMGSHIWLDGKNTGRITPDSIPWIEEKEYLITLKRFRWKDTTFKMHAYEETKVDTFINYYTNPSMYGSLKFESDPTNAEIFFRDTLQSHNTPYLREMILPGLYKVRYRYPNHRDAVTLAEVYSSRVTRVHLVLRDTTLWVDYRKNNSSIPSDNLLGITLDKKDVKWIWTGDIGLIKMEGLNFTVYNSMNSGLPSDNINQIDVDSLNNKWIGTDNGFAIFDDNTWTVYNINNSDLPNNNVTSFELNKIDGGIFVGTSNHIAIFKDNVFTIYRFRISYNNPTIVTDLEQLDNNNLWIGTTVYGLYTLSQEKTLSQVVNWEENPYSVNSLFNLPSRNIIQIEQSSDGIIWIASNPDQLEKNRGGRVERINKKGGLSIYKDSTWIGNLFLNSGEKIHSIFFDKSLSVWAATENGLYKFTSIYSFSRYKADFNMLSSILVTGVVKDSKNLVWVTTSNAGLNKFKGEVPSK